jgi:hypothetical protein
MKKILTIALIVGFVFAGTAYADFFVTGDMWINEMTVFESEECSSDGCGENIRACVLEIFFYHYGIDGTQEYTLPLVEAWGTALNIALWTAHLDHEWTTARLRYSLKPYWVEIVSVNYPSFDNDM